MIFSAGEEMGTYTVPVPWRLKGIIKAKAADKKAAPEFSGAAFFLI